jgi:excisionase family DNA binding protein
MTLTVDEFRALVREAAAEAVQKASAAPAREVMTLEEAGELLGFHAKVLAKKVEELGIPAHRIGREWRFRRSELLEWLSKQAA